MYFDPKTNKFPYPEDTDTHYLKVKKNNGLVFDQNYPYWDRSKGFRFRQALTRILLNIVVFPVASIRMGLKVKGRENLKKYRDVLKAGTLSCSNHVHMWDYIGIMAAVNPFRTNVLVWAPNVRGENGKMIRLVGGIPIPDKSFRGTQAYIADVDKLLKSGGWLQVYAEGSMWEYYAPIRPFKRGTAFFALRDDKPIIPLGYSYREPGWIRKHVFHQIAKFTLTIGEPLFVDKTLPEEERERDLTKRAHDAVARLAGIDPEKNLYPPLFDQSKRIDYYTDTYGVGYKGSW
ncbi:MAG: 1-acyl-sn-glycerol-3-phosphate acyltransferase [Lachnospiraceae bacterium]|nr:1-acyl-sn-glycerol-3-phosphate acyltransferase [Lachnospiraceae bacterium]